MLPEIFFSLRIILFPGKALATGERKIPIIFDIVMNIENLLSVGAVEAELHEAVLACRVSGSKE